MLACRICIARFTTRIVYTEKKSFTTFFTSFLCDQGKKSIYCLISCLTSLSISSLNTILIDPHTVEAQDFILQKMLKINDFRVNVLLLNCDLIKKFAFKVV